MAENDLPPAVVGVGTGSVAALTQEYKKEQAKVRSLISQREEITKTLAELEASIAQKESAYLESSIGGNIIIGFEHYNKTTGGGLSQRRRAILSDQNRVFSRSSVSYRSTVTDSTTLGSVDSAPASNEATPLSASLKDVPGAPSNQPTPTSVSLPKSAGVSNKRKLDDDSEAESFAGGRKRTNFGVVRK